MRPNLSPDLQQFIDHMTPAAGAVDLIRQPLYDYQLYPTAGIGGNLAFFSTPIGQGASSSSGNAANTKGITDTNMKLAGALGQPEAFWIESIEVDFQPGSVATAATYTIQVPSAFNATAAATVQAGENDVNAVLSGGALTLTVSNKPYYTEGPLLRFPPQCGFCLDAAVASNAAVATGEVVKAKLRAIGAPCVIQPGVGLLAQQPFNVNLTWPVAIATPSGFNGRIGVILNGWLIRPVQ